MSPSTHVIASVIASPGVKPMRASMNTDSEKNTAISPAARAATDSRGNRRSRGNMTATATRTTVSTGPGRPDRMNSASPITTGPITAATVRIARRIVSRHDRTTKLTATTVTRNAVVSSRAGRHRDAGSAG